MAWKRQIGTHTLLCEWFCWDGGLIWGTFLATIRTTIGIVGALETGTVTTITTEITEEGKGGRRGGTTITADTGAAAATATNLAGPSSVLFLGCSVVAVGSTPKSLVAKKEKYVFFFSF